MCLIVAASCSPHDQVTFWGCEDSITRACDGAHEPWRRALGGGLACAGAVEAGGRCIFSVSM